MEMHEVAEEYLRNAQAMEARVRELEKQVKDADSISTRRKIRKRISTLHTMICEAKKTAFDLEHYYDKPEENPAIHQEKGVRHIL